MSSSIPRQVFGLVLALTLAAAFFIPTKLTLYAYVSFGINWLVALTVSIPCQSEKFFDLTSSITFITLSILAAVLTTSFHPEGVPSLRSYVAASMVCLWAIRLGSFLFTRILKVGGQDRRFNGIRDLPLRFFSMYSVQALWVPTAMLPVLLLQNSTAQSTVVEWTDIVGAFLFIAGLTTETVADFQKSIFRSVESNKNSFITSGLWRYSRHPNYFGEIVAWFGIALYCSPQLPTLTLQLLAYISPLFVTILLLTSPASGMPALETKGLQRWGHLPEYQDYLARTNALIPWFPKASSLASMSTSTTYGATSNK